MESNIVREVNIKEGVVKLNTHAQEELSLEEFKRFYNQQLQQKTQLETTLSQKKEEYEKVKDAKETEELLKIKEMLKTAHKLMRKEQLITEIKDTEIRLNSIAKDMNYLNKAIQQIRNKE